jgi:hypothetical protein
MSATDRRLKVQLEEGLKKSQDAIDNVQAPPVVQLTTGPDDVDKVPWKRALVKEQQLLPLNKLSSVCQSHFQFVDPSFTLTYTVVCDLERLSSWSSGLS